MKLTLIFIGLGLGGLIALVMLVGYFLPVKHVASRAVRLRTPSSRVWAAISDFSGSPSWRTDLQRVEQVETQPGVVVWREIAKSGEALTYLTLEATAEKKLVRKIADDGLPFGGTWTFEMANENGHTLLTITENGEVNNPLFRFVSRFVFGHFASIDKYITQLKTHVGGE